MEELTNVIANNGIGVASFFALVYFYNKYISLMTDTLGRINQTLVSIQENLVSLSERVNDIENKIK